MTIATIIDAAASSNVAGRRAAIALATGSLVRNDVPRSPCAKPVRNMPYCWYNGRSRPSLPRSSLTLSSDALSPSIVRTGSPGMR